MSSRVVHYMVAADDVDAMETFYREVFGWRISKRRLTSNADVSGLYTYVEAEDGGIPGGFSNSDAVGRRGVVLVVEVDDVGATLERAERLGVQRVHAGVPSERMELTLTDGSTTSFELDGFHDPEGNLVYIIRAGDSE